jgi:hypothetical protein
MAIGDGVPAAGAMSGRSASEVLIPGDLYVTNDDQLCLTVFDAAAGVIVTVTGRMQLLGEARPKPFLQTLTPATDRSASTVRFAIGEGWLLNAQVVVTTGSPAAGQTFARLSLTRGTTSNALELFTLAANYITAKMPLSYPGSPVLGSTEGAGALRSIAGSTPAAGAEISETVPTGARWEVITFQALLTTSAAVANRIPQLVLDDGATTLFRVGAALNQAASLAQRRSWFQGAPAPYLDNANNVPMPLPENIRLPAGARIKTVTLAIDAADQYSAVQYLVREWIEGA